ncbi:hypothetical protein WM42_1045 [Corynebacterium simulans]|uniref:Uncharacterized protein n=1 Tax=Corynebacterium simulans TaxID=146827 RepID=A0ABR5VC87_9CORY|nr:hypothetical protein WM42_1045 [Corynebacterium simulans]KXU19077.1 hypothetical protein WM41_0299 [Corynebacterium simulans]
MAEGCGMSVSGIDVQHAARLSILLLAGFQDLGFGTLSC